MDQAKSNMQNAMSLLNLSHLFVANIKLRQYFSISGNDKGICEKFTTEGC